ncbi:MAG: molybdopterin-synthase adenylyltransferase [Thermoproteota archaeon]|nr:molybdopterin-synthase adenylyltransferase [Thermoproteota archaeon]
MKLSMSDLERYNRQMLMPNWGEEGQLKLKSAKIVVAGAGGLGCPVSLYLAAAGIGRLTVIDREKYELSNLNRQVLGWPKDLGKSKAESSVEKLRAFNPNIDLNALVVNLTENNVHDLIHGSNVVIDALDNWKTRFILNEACVKEKIPLIHAGIYGLSGQITTIYPGKGPCLRCIIPETPPEVKRFPVLGATPGFFAMLQVMEAMKLIIGIGESLIGRLLLFNGEDMNFNSIEINRNPNCTVCKDA